MLRQSLDLRCAEDGERCEERRGEEDRDREGDRVVYSSIFTYILCTCIHSVSMKGMYVASHNRT